MKSSTKNSKLKEMETLIKSQLIILASPWMLMKLLLPAVQIFSSIVSGEKIILRRNGYFKMLEMGMYISVLC